MTHKRKKGIEAGDIFCFQVSAKGFAYGQVLISNILQYIIIYEEILDQISSLNAEASPILLSGWTMDAKLRNGDWEIVGRIDPPTAVEFPLYKVGISGQMWVTDVRGCTLRLATAEEEAGLSFQSSHSPGLYEDAFKAHHGLAPWESYFEKLLHNRHGADAGANSEGADPNPAR
jgi:Immunity protein 26